MTEDKTTITDNEVIARFMGINQIPDPARGNELKWDFQDTGKLIFAIFSNELGYHRSWEWLMPVWYKFRDLKFENGEHTWKKYDLAVNIVYAICWKDIGESCRLLAEGIRWYNSTTQNNGK